MRRYVLFALLCLTLTVSAQSYRYWFDHATDAGFGGKAEGHQMHFDADVSGLSAGFHTLTCALLDDADGSVTSLRFAWFVKGVGPNRGYAYWFDGDASHAIKGSTTDGVAHIDADLSGLPLGFHTLTCALLDATGAVSSVRFSSFMKEGAGAKGYVYWFDSNADAAVMGKMADGVVHIDADVSKLSDGLHILNCALLDEKGDVCGIRFASFVKAEGVNVDDLRLVYRIDDGESSVSNAPQAGDGVYRFSLDVASLSTGEHTLYYMLTDGQSTYATGEETFTKIETEGFSVVTFGETPSDKVFDLNGRSVDGSAKGLHIVKGKKVVVR